MLPGYQRELTYKHDDGSYSAFGKSDESGHTWWVNLLRNLQRSACGSGAAVASAFQSFCRPNVFSFNLTLGLMREENSRHGGKRLAPSKQFTSCQEILIIAFNGLRAASLGEWGGGTPPLGSVASVRGRETRTRNQRTAEKARLS